MKRSELRSYRLFLTAGLLPVLLWVAACDRLSVKEPLDDLQVDLVNQRGETVTFPESFRGRVVLVGYLYTHCPDICPVITLNMKEVERELEGDEEAHFVAISMDPRRDTPEVMADYAERFGLDGERWSLLTGESADVERLLDRLGIIARRTPTRITESGYQIYFIDHSDRVSLMDRSGNLRRHYMGSELRGEEVVADMGSVLERGW